MINKTYNTYSNHGACLSVYHVHQYYCHTTAAAFCFSSVCFCGPAVIHRPQRNKLTNQPPLPTVSFIYLGPASLCPKHWAHTHNRRGVGNYGHKLWFYAQNNPLRLHVYANRRSCTFVSGRNARLRVVINNYGQLPTTILSGTSICVSPRTGPG